MAEREVDAIPADERREAHVALIEDFNARSAEADELREKLTEAQEDLSEAMRSASSLRKTVEDLETELDVSRAEVAKLQGRTITALVERSHEMAVEKQWYAGPPRGVPELIALCHSELSEALEEYRNGDLDGSGARLESNGKPAGLSSELADAVIRIADMAGYLGIDLEAAIEQKHNFNKTRPARHGGKAA